VAVAVADQITGRWRPEAAQMVGDTVAVAAAAVVPRTAPTRVPAATEPMAW